VMANSNIDIVNIHFKESVSYFKRLENLEKMRHTNIPGPATLPIHNEKMYNCYN
jgi:hypothetical protein